MPAARRRFKTKGRSRKSSRENVVSQDRPDDAYSPSSDSDRVVPNRKPAPLADAAGLLDCFGGSPSSTGEAAPGVSKPVKKHADIHDRSGCSLDDMEDLSRKDKYDGERNSVELVDPSERRPGSRTLAAGSSLDQSVTAREARSATSKPRVLASAAISFEPVPMLPDDPIEPLWKKIRLNDISGGGSQCATTPSAPLSRDASSEPKRQTRSRASTKSRCSVDNATASQQKPSARSPSPPQSLSSESTAASCKKSSSTSELVAAAADDQNKRPLKKRIVEAAGDGRRCVTDGASVAREFDTVGDGVVPTRNAPVGMLAVAPGVVKTDRSGEEPPSQSCVRQNQQSFHPDRPQQTLAVTEYSTPKGKGSAKRATRLSTPYPSVSNPGVESPNPDRLDGELMDDSLKVDEQLADERPRTLHQTTRNESRVSASAGGSHGLYQESQIAHCETRNDSDLSKRVEESGPYEDKSNTLEGATELNATDNCPPEPALVSSAQNQSQAIEVEGPENNEELKLCETDYVPNFATIGGEKSSGNAAARASPQRDTKPRRYPPRQKARSEGVLAEPMRVVEEPQTKAVASKPNRKMKTSSMSKTRNPAPITSHASPNTAKLVTQASSGIHTLNDSDVVCGLGIALYANNHPGNIQYRRLVRENHARYRQLVDDHSEVNDTRSARRGIMESMLQKVRFVKKGSIGSKIFVLEDTDRVLVKLKRELLQPISKALPATTKAFVAANQTQQEATAGERKKNPTVRQKRQSLPAKERGSETLELNDNDVICGCAGYSRMHQAHAGSIRYRQLLRENRRPSDPVETETIAHSIIEEISNLDPPGRFLRETFSSSGKWLEADSRWTFSKVKNGIHEIARPCVPEPMQQPSHEPDPELVFIEERAFLYHNPPAPGEINRSADQAVSAADLPPIPKPSPYYIPQGTRSRWKFDEDSRTLLVDFNQVDSITEEEKHFFGEAMQRDDITVISDGLFKNINADMFRIEYIDELIGRERLHRFRKFKKDSSGEYIKYTEEKGDLTMKVSDYREYIARRSAALESGNSGEIDTLFKFFNHSEKLETIDVINDSIYMIDLDMPTRLQDLFDEFKQSVKLSEVLPYGDWCMMNKVPYTVRPFMGPNLYVTPEGAFTQLHQDGHGTVDSGHYVVSGYNEVVMLRRLSERHKRHACQIALPRGSDYDPLYNTPHADNQGKNDDWYSNETIAAWKAMNYCPSTFILKPGQHVHINKGRLHAFRKCSTDALPETDCHAGLRKALVQEKNLTQKPLDPCVSVAYDWMYRGVDAEGISREVVTVLECAAMNKCKKLQSLAIPQTSVLFKAKSLKARATLGKNQELLDEIRGILPALRYVVCLESQGKPMASKVRNIPSSIVTDTVEPLASENLQTHHLDPFGSDYTCKLCRIELPNSYMHCDGCEELLVQEFNICVECHKGGAFRCSQQMNRSCDDHSSSVNHHLGALVSNTGRAKCDHSQACRSCKKCSHCSCQCHAAFTHFRRFHSEADLKSLLQALETIVGDAPLNYADETELRLALLVDGSCKAAIEKKRRLLAKLRGGNEVESSSQTVAAAARETFTEDEASRRTVEIELLLTQGERNEEAPLPKRLDSKVEDLSDNVSLDPPVHMAPSL